MRDQVIRDIDAVEERAHTEISALAYIDPNNLPEREDWDWREIVKLGKERLQDNVNTLNRWLDAPLEEEGTP